MKFLFILIAVASLTSCGITPEQIQSASNVVTEIIIQNSK